MQETIITIFEDYPCRVPDYEAHLQNLYAFRDIVGVNNFSLQTDGTLQIMHYVGFFQKGDTSIQVLPKVYARVGLEIYTESEIHSSLDFICRLLYWSGYLKHKHLLPQSQGSSKTDLLEIFIHIFITEFENLFRQKIYRTYEQQEANQQFVKGKILFSETARRNPILKHLHYVRFDEFTFNNHLNRIFKSLIHHLLKKTNNRDNKKKLVSGLSLLPDVDLINLEPSVFKKIKFDRLNAEFEPLFNLAKLFYYNNQPGFTEGKDNTFSFLLKLNDLFENFIGKVLIGLSDSENEIRYHEPEIRFGKYNGNKVFPLKPDFTISRNTKVVTVLDTKYKYPFDNKGNVAISTGDLYQLSTYAMAYDCHELFLIYPKFLGSPISENRLAHYELQTAFGIVNLQVLQVDIMETELAHIVNDMKSLILYPADSSIFA